MKWLAVVLGALGVIVGAIAVVYFTVPAHSLPSILGGVAGAKPHVHRVHRGDAAAGLAGVLLVLAAILGIIVWRAPNRAEATWRGLLGR